MPGKPVIIGLDIGTTACKAVAVDRRSVVATGRGSYRTHSDTQGRAEQRFDDVWAGVTDALRDVTTSLSSGSGTFSIEAVSLSGAMHTLMPIGHDDQPLAPAITYADGRAADTTADLRRAVDTLSLYRRTGCPVQTAYHLSRLRWWRHADPDIFDRATKWVAIKGTVAHALTGEWATDFGIASTTGLLDLHTLKWDAESLHVAGITADALPQLIAPTGVVGGVRAGASRATGLPEGTPIIAGGSDGALANVGAGAVSPGDRVVTVGTSGAVRAVCDRPVLDERERTWCYLIVEGRYLAGGAINNGGLAVQWVRERFFADIADDDHAYDALAAEAAAVAPGSDGLVLLPYLTGERSPHFDADLRAVVTGLTLAHTRGHIARAAMEGVACCLADVRDALGPAARRDAPIRLTGGVADPAVFRQILAGVLDAPVVPVSVDDASAIGAATIAMVALGWLDKLDDAEVDIDQTAIVTPDASHRAAYEGVRERFAARFELARPT